MRSLGRVSLLVVPWTVRVMFTFFAWCLVHGIHAVTMSCVRWAIGSKCLGFAGQGSLGDCKETRGSVEVVLLVCVNCRERHVSIIHALILM
jgi:hypothetical protein